MSKMHDLLFKMDDIPLDILSTLRDYHLVSGQPTKARRYLLILAETCNVGQYSNSNILILLKIMIKLRWFTGDQTTQQQRWERSLGTRLALHVAKVLEIVNQVFT